MEKREQSCNQRYFPTCSENSVWNNEHFWYLRYLVISSKITHTKHYYHYNACTEHRTCIMFFVWRPFESLPGTKPLWEHSVEIRVFWQVQCSLDKSTHILFFLSPGTRVIVCHSLATYCSENSTATGEGNRSRLMKLSSHCSTWENFKWAVKERNRQGRKTSLLIQCLHWIRDIGYSWGTEHCKIK